MQLNSIGGVMLGSTRKGRETAGVGSDRQAANFLPFSRRSFLAKTSYFGASYAGNGTPVWAHVNTAKRIVESYGAMQGADKTVALAPLERAIKDAKTDLARKHREENLGMVTNIFNIVNGTVLALPNHPIDPAKLPMKMDLGGLTAVIESYPGHSGTDIIVRVPEQNVVYTGDLLFSGLYPVCF